MDITATCQKTGKAFLITKQEQDFYKRLDLPLPIYHPTVRRELRDRFMPSPNYSWQKCSTCNTTVLIELPETYGRPVRCIECREKIEGSVTPVGVDYIPGKFLEQYNSLVMQTAIRGYPAFRPDQGGGENLTRCVECSYSKNCVECFDLSKCINCINCQEGLIGDTDCIDLTQSSGCELCVDMIGCLSCYKCAYLEDCLDCSDTFYSDNCSRSKNCFGCSGLRDKSYYIFNKKYEPEEYKQKVAELMQMSPKEIEAMKNKELADVPVPASLGQAGNEDSYFTNQTFNCKSTYYAFYSQLCINSGYMWQCEKIDDSWDMTMVRHAKDSYQVSDNSYSNNCYFSTSMFECRNNWFCFDNYKVENAWGCVLLSDKKYCILNKEYSKEEYERLTKQIRDELNLHYNGQ